MNSYIKCGDCFELMKDISDDSVDMILCDIPYECKKRTNFKTIKDFTKKTGATEYCCMDFGEWDTDFDLRMFMKESCRVLKPHKSMVIWCNWMQLKKVYEYYLKFIPKKYQREPRIGVWQKSNPSVFNMQRMAIQPYEFFIWLGKGSNITFNNINDGKPERHYFYSATQRGYHPTLKCVEHLEHLIRTYTNVNDIVFDACMGSGTTCIAAIKTNRKYIGFELDEKYFKMAEQRIKNCEVNESYCEV